MLASRLLVILVLGLLAGPPVVQAQPAGKTYRIGHLGNSNPVAARTPVDALRQRLREHGWVEGRNLVIEFRWADGQFDRLPALAAELVALGVDLIVAQSDAPTRAAKSATTTIPIVMVGVSDPVAAGFVASLARPAGNLTGITWDPAAEVAGKRLELLRETVPAASRIAVLWNPDAPPSATAPSWTELRSAARRLGVTLESVEARRAADLEPAFATMARSRADAVLVFTTAISFNERARVAALALQHRLPTMFSLRENVDAGGLMFYGVTAISRNERSAFFIDRILRGARPADLPVEQPTKIELVINLRTAKALGLTMPPSVLMRVDDVID